MVAVRFWAKVGIARKKLNAIAGMILFKIIFMSLLL